MSYFTKRPLSLYNEKWCVFSVTGTKYLSIIQMNFRPQTDHIFFMVYRSAVFLSTTECRPCNSQTVSRQTYFFYVEIKCQLDATNDFYCRSYCLLNMFRAPLCPYQELKSIIQVFAACGIWCFGFQVVGIVWS